jgi:hypothetical protein
MITRWRDRFPDASAVLWREGGDLRLSVRFTRSPEVQASVVREALKLVDDEPSAGAWSWIAEKGCWARRLSA